MCIRDSNSGKPNEVSAVIDVNAFVRSGEITAFVGPSGCGKTTLMSMIGLLLTPTKGKIIIEGKDVTTFSDHWKSIFRRENMGFVFQHINLFPRYNALENVLLPLLCHNVDPSDHRNRTIELLGRLGLSERANFSVEQLSGGQQQRVAIARALVTDPKIVVADEPLTFVDTKSADIIMQVMKELRDEGKTILLSTHYRELARLADKTYEMKDGKIVQGDG